MKKVLLTIFLMMGIWSNSFSYSVKIGWTANSEPDLAGYRVYYGISSRNYSNIIDVGNITSHIVDNLELGTTYYFAATAYDSANNESDYSNEIDTIIFEIQLLDFAKDDLHRIDINDHREFIRLFKSNIGNYVPELDFYRDDLNRIDINDLREFQILFKRHIGESTQ